MHSIYYEFHACKEFNVAKAGKLYLFEEYTNIFIIHYLDT